MQINSSKYRLEIAKLWKPDGAPSDKKTKIPNNFFGEYQNIADV